MTKEFNSIEIAANAFILQLNKNNIFPPLFNDPKIFTSQKRRKRSPNAFFICRINVHKEALSMGLIPNMRILSKATSILWKNASSTEKYDYTKLAYDVKIYWEKVEMSSIETSKNSFNNYYNFPLSSSSSNIQITDEETTSDYNLLNQIQSIDTTMYFPPINDIFEPFNFNF